MSFVINSLRLFTLACVLQLLSLQSIAQPLTVDISDISFSRLPRITFKACVQQDGEYLRGLDSSNFLLMENGVPQHLIIRCPDPTKYNSVVLVLDNSGSILPALPKLKEAAARLVDSLDVNDECAIITFGQRVTVLQDFTSDKALLKQRLQTMIASGGTPLFDASVLATNMLGTRNGNRFGVIITDGEDNLSQFTKDDVIANANLVSAKLYTIAFDVNPLYQGLMEEMAVETGGEFFAVVRPSELNNVYETIADLITEKCCIAEYFSTSCPDTLRSILLNVSLGSEMGTYAGTYSSPSRPPTSQLILDVPDGLTPLATGFGFIDMVPPPAMDLLLTLGFTLKYDENLIQIPLLPFILGTVTQDQNVRMANIGPGEMRFELQDIRPAVSTGRLVGFTIGALLADSSRYADFTITDIDITGCPTEFSTNHDSTLVCQCFQALEVQLDSGFVISPSGIARFPVNVGGGIETGLTMTARMSMALSEGLSVVDVLPGNVLPSGSLSWEVRDGLLNISVPTPVIPQAASGALAVIQIQAAPSKEPKRHHLQFVFSELWQRCCPADGELPYITLMQDGECTFIVRRRTPAPTISIAPHPVVERNGGTTNITMTLPESEADAPVLLRITDLEGRVVRTLFSGTMPPGEHVIPFDAKGLPSGRYVALLTACGRMVTQGLLYIR